MGETCLEVGKVAAVFHQSREIQYDKSAFSNLPPGCFAEQLFHLALLWVVPGRDYKIKFTVSGIPSCQRYKYFLRFSLTFSALAFFFFFCAVISGGNTQIGFFYLHIHHHYSLFIFFILFPLPGKISPFPWSHPHLFLPSQFKFVVSHAPFQYNSLFGVIITSNTCDRCTVEHKAFVRRSLEIHMSIYIYIYVQSAGGKSKL